MLHGAVLQRGRITADQPRKKTKKTRHSRLLSTTISLLLVGSLTAVSWSSRSSHHRIQAVATGSVPALEATGAPTNELHRFVNLRLQQAVSAGLTTKPRPVVQKPAPTPTTAATVPAPPEASGSGHAAVGYGCRAAYAWLAGHAAPGFHFVCPGNALGHQAMTCEDVAGVCPAEKVIVIAVPCPAAYMNEAHNSWILAGLARGALDPYGYCH